MDLWQAAAEGNIQAVQDILAKGTPVDEPAPAQTPYHGGTALQLAAHRGHLAVVKQLVEAGADIHKETPTQAPALHLAAATGQTPVMKLLIDAGAMSDATSQNSTPLLYAATGGHPAALQLLVDAGAAVDQSDSTTWTPLHCAAHNNHAEAIKVLLATGADVSAVTQSNRTPLDLAVFSGQAAAVEALLQHAPVPTASVTTLASHVASIEALSHNMLEVLSVLLKHIAERDRGAAVQLVRGMSAIQGGVLSAFRMGWLSAWESCSAAAEQQKAEIAEERSALQQQRQEVQKLIVGMAAMSKQQQLQVPGDVATG